jgi:hypothetical protein
MRILLSALCLFLLLCACSTNDEDPAELASLQQQIARLEKEVSNAEAIRAVKHLQNAYGHYAELGLWHDLADLFSDEGIGHYPAGKLGREAIRRLFLDEVGQGKLGLNEGRFYPHIMLQPIVTVDPEGSTARGRWHVLAMLGGYGENAIWAGGIYENRYVRENGIWKIKELHYYSQYNGRYDQAGWTADQNSIPMPCDPARAGMPVPSKTPDEDLPPNPPSVENLAEKLGKLTRRIRRLDDESRILNLQKIYGYYVDRKMWDDVADLFAEDGTLERGQQGVYVGKSSIRKALDRYGPEGLRRGEVNDHLQLQIVAHVAPDGRSARARGVELVMWGVNGKGAEWREGIFENEYVKQEGIWKIKSMHLYTRMRTDYEKGWAKDAKPAPGPSRDFPPDRPPSVVYESFPRFHIPPLHFENPVTGKAPKYPKGMTPNVDLLSHRMRQHPDSKDTTGTDGIQDLAKEVADIERMLRRAVAYDAAENLASAYGYYLDEFMWDGVADLFALDGKRDLGSIAFEVGREEIRQSLKRRYPGTKSKTFFTVHQLVQPVVHVAADGRSANMRVRLFQLGGVSGGSGHWIAGMYETRLGTEDGVWKFNSLDLDYTWTADYRKGWANITDDTKGIISTPFPEITDLPFHYRNPVSGRAPALYEP